MNASVVENAYEKQIEDLRNKLQMVNYDLEEIKFTSESKIIQL